MVNTNQEDRGYITFGQLNIITGSRFNWVRLNIWIRLYVISLAGGLGNLEQTAERLYRAPLDFYNMLLPILGRENAEQFLNYLSVHIITLQALANAMINNDTEAVSANSVRLYQNADRLANFLARINPYWSETVWKSLLYENISMTTNEIVNYLSSNYAMDITIFDRLLEQALEMGDYMSRGLFNFLNTPITTSKIMLKFK